MATKNTDTNTTEQDSPKKSIFNVFGSRRHDASNPTAHESQPVMVTIKSFFKILTPYWTSKESVAGWLQLIGIALFTTMSIYLAKQFNDWYKEFWDNVQNYNLDGFIGGLILFAFLATLHVCTVVYRTYIISALIIRWRRWLTKHYLDRYLKNGAFYALQLTDTKTDNPDQRIAEDLNQFVSSTITIIISVVTDLAMLGTFSIILWGLSSEVHMEFMGFNLYLPEGYLFYLALGYAFIGTIITFVMGKPLVLLNFRQQRYEADFRFALIRLRENAESVAIYKGEQQEHKRFHSLFLDVVGNYVTLITKTKNLGFFTLSYFQTAVIFPILISAPMYFAKIITIGSLMQINSAFSKVQDSLSTIIQNFTSIAQWKAVIDRLALFEQSMQQATTLPKPAVVESSDHVGVTNLSVSTPEEKVLIHDLNLALGAGDSLLIQGHSGCGKSTLLRTMAGIWPYAQGHIQMPKDSVLFLSQKPYMPLGTLKDAICYPQKSDFSDEEIQALLQQVGLAHLQDKLYVIDQWGHLLSLGEQQRIAFLRALLIKPKVIFLDEVTSALDEDNEQKLYGMLKQTLQQSVVISIGHRSTLKAFHNRYLLIADDRYTLDGQVHEY